MKKIISVLLLLLFLISPFFTYNLEARTLRDYYNELNEIEAKKNRTAEEKAAAQAKQRQYQAQIDASQKAIANAQAEISRVQNEIVELEIKIKETEAQIKDLLRFKQISSGDNLYLEYIFSASDFTDFIYKSAVVEQLSGHNDKLINDSRDMIEKNKKLKVELEGKIAAEQKESAELQKLFKSNQVSLDDLTDVERYTDADIKAKREEIEYLESKGCEMDQELLACIDVPFSAAGFTRPLTRGTITDEFGWREKHPITGNRRFHAGIDIGVPIGTPVYASATGIVGYNVYSSSGGGIQVILYHNISGKGYTTIYMHLNSINVSQGDFVTPNTIIAYSGNTGGSTGPHLHFEIHEGQSTSSNTAVNPRYYVTFPGLDNSFFSRY